MTTTRNRTTADDTTAPETPPDYCVLGGGHLGEAVTRRLQAAGHEVHLVDETRTPEDLPAERGDPADVDLLAAAGVGDASTVVVATPEDGRNLLVAQLVRAHFDVPEVLVLVNVPDRCDVVADVGHEPVCATAALTDTLFESATRGEQQG
jgi:trk system potassium uptake protein TrkA